MKVFVTGANGFIAKNLIVHFHERGNIDVLTFVRGDSATTLSERVAAADMIFHLAGVNRPKDETEFEQGNTDLTRGLCEAIQSSGRKIPIVFASSIQAERDNPYGRSKNMAEQLLNEMSATTGSPTFIYRLPNVFGKWCRPNYNSAVATFCHNIAHDLPIRIDDPDANIRLVYVDDVVQAFLQVFDNRPIVGGYQEVEPVYEITVGDLAKQLQMFKASRSSLVIERVGAGLTRALYSTYISYFDAEQFSYSLIRHEDPRGVFVEVLKTHDSGQFSYFTAHPGITRGGHYHHSKTEKFLVIKGEACFRFRHMASGEFHELFTTGEQPEIVETVPGWTHDITNVGDEEMIVMLWANEIFDREAPDTYAKAVGTEK